MRNYASLSWKVLLEDESITTLSMNNSVQHRVCILDMFQAVYLIDRGPSCIWIWGWRWKQPLPPRGQGGESTTACYLRGRWDQTQISFTHYDWWWLEGHNVELMNWFWRFKTCFKGPRVLVLAYFYLILHYYKWFMISYHLIYSRCRITVILP